MSKSTLNVLASPLALKKADTWRTESDEDLEEKKIIINDKTDEQERSEDQQQKQ